jgi:hypothetical protein
MHHLFAPGPKANDKATAALCSICFLTEDGHREIYAVNSVFAGEVTTSLTHELFDGAVESGPLVVKRLAGFADSLLAGAQRTEIFGGCPSQCGPQ